MFAQKPKIAKAFGIGDLIPYALTFGFSVLMVAVVALVLNGFQSSNTVTLSGVGGATGNYGIYIQANYIGQAGNIITNGVAGGTLGGGGGAGTIYFAFFGNQPVATFNGYAPGNYGTTGGTGSGAGGNGQVITYNYFASAGTSPPVNVFPAGGTACTNNLASGFCSGSVTYAANTVLTGNINASTDVIINAGVVVYSNGYDFIAGNMFQNKGTIVTNSIGNGGSVTSLTGQAGVSYTNSFGGSGGGASGCVYAGGAGGTTNGIAAPAGGAAQGSGACVSGTAGSTPTAPSTSNALSIAIANGGQTKWLAGAGGGSSGGQVTVAYNAIGNGLTSASNIASQFGLLGTVIGLGLVLGVVLSIFGFGRKGNETL